MGKRLLQNTVERNNHQAVGEKSLHLLHHILGAGWFLEPFNCEVLSDK